MVTAIIGDRAASFPGNMKASAILSILAGALPLLAAPTEPARRQDNVIPGKFIVQLKPGSSPESVSAHQLRVRGMLGRRDESIKETYQIGDFNAYSGDFDSTTAETIASLPEVLSVEPDEYIYVEKTDFDSSSKRALTTQKGALWALGDLSHKLNGSTDYVYDDRAGQGQTAYVLDTGIRLTHTEFESTRAVWGFNGVTGSATQTGTNSDDDSHGTHVAGSIVGKVNGVAKKAKVVDVKVFSGGGVSGLARNLIRKSATLLMTFALGSNLSGIGWPQLGCERHHCEGNESHFGHQHVPV